MNAFLRLCTLSETNSNRVTLFSLVHSCYKVTSEQFNSINCISISSVYKYTNSMKVTYSGWEKMKINEDNAYGIIYPFWKVLCIKGLCSTVYNGLFPFRLKLSHTHATKIKFHTLLLIRNLSNLLIYMNYLTFNYKYFWIN